LDYTTYNKSRVKIILLSESYDHTFIVGKPLDDLRVQAIVQYEVNKFNKEELTREHVTLRSKVDLDMYNWQHRYMIEAELHPDDNLTVQAILGERIESRIRTMLEELR